MLSLDALRDCRKGGLDGGELDECLTRATNPLAVVRGVEP